MEIPKRVKTTVDSLRKERNKYIAVMKKRDNYYAYESTSIWDKDEKKVKSKMLYLGKIDDEGTFIPAKKRSGSLVEHLTSSFPKQIRDKISSLSERYTGISVSKIEDNTVYLNFINERGEKKFLGTLAEDGAFLNKSKEIETENKEYELGDVDKKILTCLSMNARMPLSRLAKMVGISHKSAYYRVRSLEKKFDVKYLCEIDITKLGYMAYLVFVKFEDGMPDITKLRSTIIKQHKIQLAGLLRGEYDLLLYIIDKDPLKADSELLRFRTEDVFKNHKSTWYLIPFDFTFSFVPLRKEFIKDTIKEGYRDLRSSYGTTGILSLRKLRLLEALCENSCEAFNELDADLGFGKGTSRYIYHELREKGIILRATINMEVAIKYIGIILRETVDATKLLESLPNIRKDIIESYNGIINRYLLVGIIGAPAGIAYFLPAISNTEFDINKEFIESISKGSKFRSLVLTDILVGSFCFRRFDGTYSKVYESLAASGVKTWRSRIDYEGNSSA